MWASFMQLKNYGNIFKKAPNISGHGGSLQVVPLVAPFSEDILVKLAKHTATWVRNPSAGYGSTVTKRDLTIKHIEESEL